MSKDSPQPDGVEPPSDERLPAALQRRGRWLAIGSHPFSMLFRVVHLRGLATQALVTLGAAEAVVGLHASLGPFATILQLPALKLMDKVGKKRLLLLTQLVALLSAAPLLWFADLKAMGPAAAAPIAIASLAVTAMALMIGSTAWWPLLHGFVSPDRTSRFFAVLRTGWHFWLIAFFFFSAWWLDVHPGAFGLLFLLAWACGVIRACLVPFFPERRESNPLRLKETLGMLWATSSLRRYLIGVTLETVVVQSVGPFMIYMLRKEIGLDEGQTLFATTIPFFLGGLLALYPAGRLADRYGARPVLLLTCLLRGGLIAALGFITLVADTHVAYRLATGLAFSYALLTAGFGVAEIKVLFQLAPQDTPSSTIVVVVVVRSVIAGLSPLLAGIALRTLHGAGTFPPEVLYQGFFVVFAAVQVAALLPFLKKGRVPPA